MRAFGTLFINGGNFGWSEVYPMNVADYPTAVTNMTTTLTKRLALLVSDLAVVGMRISDSDVKGDSYPTGLTFPQVGTFAVAPADATYNADLAIRAEFVGALTQRSQRWIRGLPKSQVSNVGAYAPTGPFTTALTSYLAQVLSTCAAAHRIPGAVTAPFYTFTNYSGYTLVGNLLSRKLGRPFGLSRGRRLVA